MKKQLNPPCRPLLNRHLRQDGTELGLRLVQSGVAQLIFHDAFLVTFNGRSGFALSYLGRFLIKFTAVNFGKGSGLLTGTFKASQSEIERFVISYFH